MRKRIISVLLLLTITISSLPIFGLTANAALLGEYDIYDAAELARTDGYEIFFAWYHTVMSTKSRDESFDEYCDVLLYNHFIEANNKDTISLTAKTIWASVNTDLEMVEEDVYTALLLKMIAGDFSKEEDNSLLKTIFDGSKDALGFTGVLCDVFQTERSMKALETFFAACEAKKKDSVQDKLWYKFVDACNKQGLSDKNWGRLGTFLDILGWIWDSTETYMDVVERIDDIINLIELDTAYLNVLNEMYQDKNNSIFLRGASRELYNILSSDEYLAQKIDKIESIAKGDGNETIARNTIATLAKSIISIVNPALYATIGAVDIFLGVTDEVKSVYTMYAMAEMERAIFAAVANIRDDFKSTQTIDMAKSYKAGLEMCFVFAYQTCHYVDDHLYNVFKKGLIKEWVRNQESYEIYKEVLSDSKEHILKSYQNAINSPKELYEKCINKLDTEYFITYNANGGLNEPSVQIKKQGTSITLSSTKPTRRGYIFSGWSTNPKATSSSFNPGQTYSTDSDLTLYAVWKPGTFDIVFHANGGQYSDGSTSITKQKVYLQNFTINLEQPTRDGYKFTGIWALYSDGSGSKYTHGNTYNDIGGAGLSTKHLYAVWQDIECVVEYDYNDNTGNPPIEDVVNVETTPTYTIKKPNKDENIFKGWMFLDPNGSYWWTDGNWDNGKVSVIQPSDTLQLTGDLTLYAKWDYYVHYDHGTGYTHDVVRNGSNYKIDSPTYKNGDKVFVNWKCVQAGGAVSYYAPGDTVNLTSDMMLQAVWSDPADILSGDINGDSKVNNKDLFTMQKYLAGVTVTVVQETLDIDGNGTVNNADFTRLHQYLTGYDVEINP